QNYKIYSPIDGTITTVSSVVGDSVKSGDTLVSIRDFNQMQFTISIDELDISKVKVGQKASITIDALAETTAKPLSGEVIYKAMEGTSTNGVATYDVTIKINETENLLAGMNANANIILSGSNNTLMLPLEAITKMGDRAFVRVIGTADASSQGQIGNRMNQGNRQRRNTTGTAPSSNNESSNESSTDSASSNSTVNNSGNSNAAGDSSNTADNKGNTDNSNWASRQGGAAVPNRQQSAAFTANQKYYANTIMKEVELGINNDEYVEIKSGLSEGEVVVLPPLVTNSTGSNSNTQNGFSLGGIGGGTRAMGGFNGGTGAGTFNRNPNSSGNNSTNRQSQSQRN
ncbi:MAG: efflux RND transporter periplasmic adaptor subunit, partial [Ruminiclostridium sp.]